MFGAAKIAVFFMCSQKKIVYPGIHWIIPALLMLFSGGCGSDAERRLPDVSDIEVDASIKRFDRDFFALDTTRLDTAMIALAERYPAMLPLFTVNIIHDQSNPRETPLQAARAFLTAPGVRQLYDTVQQAYPDLAWLEAELKPMLQYYRYYFPDKPVPEVVTIISAFGTDAFTYGDSLCGIGLDMFLGENFPGYDPDIFPQFLRRQFKPEYISVRLAKALAQNRAGEPAGERLIDYMLHNGKVLYIVDCLLPRTPDSLKLGYTREQWEGSIANEQAVWARMLEQNLLYSSEYKKWQKLVAPSPNAPIVFQEAPGEIGNWIGLQIVHAYMRRHPNTALSELLSQRDSQKFLEASRYKPKRQ